MWTLKTKGETYYVKHVTAHVGWSTKETPDNEHTKGSLKFKNVTVTIENDEAVIRDFAVQESIRSGEPASL